MSRQRVQQGSASSSVEASAEDPSNELVEAGDVRGEHTALGGRKGVRIMFNAVQRDADGGTIQPGERTVSAEEATRLVKDGIATIIQA